MKISKIFIPDDTASLSVGSEDVAFTFNNYIKSRDIEIVRTGSRGLFLVRAISRV